MNLSNPYDLKFDKPDIKCTILFEDNNAALELLANQAKYRLQTKHIALKFHHHLKREHDIKHGLVKILPIDTKEQLANQFTKALDMLTFKCHRKGTPMGR